MTCDGFEFSWRFDSYTTNSLIRLPLNLLLSVYSVGIMADLELLALLPLLRYFDTFSNSNNAAVVVLELFS